MTEDEDHDWHDMTNDEEGSLGWHPCLTCGRPVRREADFVDLLDRVGDEEFWSEEDWRLYLSDEETET